MPGKVRVKIIAGRNLPVMDRSNDSADAYVEIKLANVTYKTDVYRKSLNPQWNTDFYRFELDDAELQDEPLQIRLMDHDTYTANDAIGKVSISLNPLLLPSSSLIGGGCGVGAQTQTIVSEKGAVMAGWIPVFDTMHGIRGEVNVVVKVDLFSDVNKFRQSSCGVQFFHSPNIPHGYHAQIIHGFVEELVVNDDPEYQWIDKIRTPRASNDARQLVFLRLSGQVQRKIGLKAIDLGANAVIGYTQCFDLEGDVGVVARGIGTAVTLEKMPSLVGAAGGGYSDEQLRNLKFFQHFDRNYQSDQSLPNCSAFVASSTTGIYVEPATPLESPDAAVVASFAPMFSSSRSGSTRTLFADLAKKSGAPADGGSPATVGAAPAEVNAVTGAVDDDGSAEDLSNLRQLLDQEDQRGKSAHSVLRRRIQHIGRASRNALAKTRLLRRKSREDLEIARSLSESLSELSLYAASSASQLPSSLSDLKVAAHLGKRSSRRGSRRRSSTSSGEGMAALLVSSLMAAPSLNCIKETEVATSSAPNAAEEEEEEMTRACTGTSEVVANHLDVEPAAFKPPPPPSTLMATKLNAASSTGSVSQNSVSNLSVLSSVTSLMSSMSSISENCDDADNECGEESDLDAMTRLRLHQAGASGAIGNSLVAPETVSMVVKTVLALEDHSRQTPTPSANIGSVSRQTSSTQLQLLQMCQHHQRHHHPLDSNLLPAYLHPAADNESDIWIKPGSTVDEPEINDSERESMFHDLKENIVETMHTLQDHMMTSSSFTSAGGVAASAAEEHLFHMAVAQMLREQAALMGAPDGCVRDPSEESDRHPAKTDQADVLVDATGVDHSLGSGLAQTPRRSHSFRLKSLRQRLASFCTRATSPALMAAASLRTMIPRRLRTRSESAKYSHDLHATAATAPAPAKAMSLSPRARRPIEMAEMTGMADAAALATAGESYGSTIDLTGTKMTRIKPFISLSDLTRRTTLLKPIETGCDQLDVLSPSSTSASIDRTNYAVLLAPPPSSAPSPPPISTTASRSRSSSPLPLHTTTTPPSNDDRRPSATAAGSATGKHSTATSAKDIGHVRAESSSATTAYAHSPKSSAAAANNGSGATAVANASPKTGADGKDASMCRRSSDSDLALTPKANHEHSQHIQQQHQHHLHQQRHLPPPIYNARASTTKLKLRQLQPDSLDMLEYPFLTLSKYPTGFILHIGATVCARSVKLLERVPNPDEPETRDSWWKELRMEIRSHARTLGCNVILGYSETTSISDEVCVLSATGTAAIINVSPSASGEFGLLNAAVNPPTAKKSHQLQQLNANNNANNNDEVADKETPVAAKNTPPLKATDGTNGASAGGIGGGLPAGVNSAEQTAASGGAISDCANCSLCHIPYSRASVPFNAHMKKCLLCKNSIVPDVLLATIELPDALPLTGRGCFLQAQVCRTKKDLKSESNAKEISDCLPFLEYDLHRLLINKLKMKGMNAVFGLKSTVTIGEKVIALIATGTAVFVPALPPPTLPKIVAGNSWTNTEKLQDVQRALQETVDRNREVYQLKSLSELEALDSGADDSGDEGDGADGKSPELGGGSGGGGGPGGVLGAGAANNKGTFVLEVDDIEDLEIIALLMEPCPPDGFHVVNTQTVPGGAQPGGAHAHLVRNLQMFTQIWRAKLGAGAGPTQHHHNHHHHHQGGGHGHGHHHGGGHGSGANSSGSNFARHFQRLLQTIFFKLRTMLPCAICDLRFSLALPDTDEIQLLVTGMAIGLCDTSKMKLQKFSVHDKEDELIFNLEEEHQQHQQQMVQQEQQEQHRSVKSPGHHLVQTGSLKVNPSAHTEQHRRFATASRVSRERYGVELTPLSYVPGGHIQKYHGNVNFFFIRESTSIRESGGVSGFVHSFITEMLAVVRAHVTALGGNALVSFYMTELELVDNPHKNQGQCLISVGGDVVFVSYYVGE